MLSNNWLKSDAEWLFDMQNIYKKPVQKGFEPGQLSKMTLDR